MKLQFGVTINKRVCTTMMTSIYLLSAMYLLYAFTVNGNRIKYVLTITKAQELDNVKMR